MNFALPPQFADGKLSLTIEEVHVWQAALELPEDRLAALAALLSAEEQARAARFHQETHRRRYVAGRGVLRLLLSRYVDRAPELLRFEIGPTGKPSLAAECNPTGLQFNRSDSDAQALYAFCLGRRVGIDIEKISEARDVESLARSFFTPNEAATLLALPEAQRLPAFFACWTRKEAYLKARGDGLTFGLDRFEVSLLPNAPARLLTTPFDPSETTRWSLHDLAAPTGYAAALALETPPDAPFILKQSDMCITV